MTEARYRDASLALSLAFLGLFGSSGLPWFGRRSALEGLDNRPGNIALVVLHFGMPLVAAAITLSRSIRGREPQRPSFLLLTFQELLKAFAGLFALFALTRRFSFGTEQIIAVSAVLSMVSLQAFALIRGSRREGWARWAHLLAAMVPWHLFVAGALLIEHGSKHPLPGPWAYFFSVAALLPLMIWVLWPRRSPSLSPPKESKS